MWVCGCRKVVVLGANMDVQLFVENDDEGYVISVRDEEVTRVGG